MSTLARTATGDVAIPLQIERDAPTFTARKLADQFNFWKGEWFINTSEGFPWVERVFSLKAPTLTQIRALLHQAILETPLVASVVDLQLSVDRTTGALDYVFTAKMTDGQVVTGGAGRPFVVTGSSSQ